MTRPPIQLAACAATLIVLIGPTTPAAKAQCGFRVEPLTLDETVAVAGMSIIDLELSQPISVANVPLIGLDAWKFTNVGVGDVTVSVQFLSGGAMVTDSVHTLSFSSPSGTPIAFTHNSGVPVSAGAESVDTLRFKVTQSNAGMTSTLTGIYPADTIRLIFAPETASVQLINLPDWDHPVTVTGDQTTGWEPVMFDAPVPVSVLRTGVVTGGHSFSGISGANHSASQETQLLLDDEATVSLDDWWTPAQGNAPPAGEHWYSVRAFRLFDADALTQIGDASVVGIRRRFHSTGQGSFTWTFSGSRLRLVSGGASADVNADGTVDVDDLLAVLSAWGEAGGLADTNEDGSVDVDDLVAVLADWGPCP